MFDRGDILLFALSAWKETTWSTFKKAFDSLHRVSVGTKNGGEAEPVRFVRARTLRMLLSLGHCDADFSEAGELIIAPPALVALPQPGLPRAVLCGSRSPGTVSTLQRICRESGQELRIAVQRQELKVPYAPTRVEIQAESHAALERCATTLQITCLNVPPAWLQASAAGSAEEYFAALNWTTQPEINWEREDFNPQQLAFYPTQINAKLRLSRYKDPIRLQWQHRLIRENMSASIHPDWGRYIILNAESRDVLLYAETTGSVAVPRGASLPSLLARILTLCSGHAAEFVPASLIRPNVGENFGFDLYRNVPPDVFAVVKQKLGQRDQARLVIEGNA